MENDSAPRPAPPAAPFRVAAHAAVLGVTFLSLLAWTWGTWPDVLVDFGRELYVPWQITLGKRLYADLAWFNGPLSPYWNALMFRLFGVGLRTLVWVNAVLFALILGLLHSLLRAFASRASATAACLMVLATCGFGQLVGIGNYNYICPYSHEATHGLLLGLAALVCAQRWAAGGRRRALFLAGAFVGLSFLTKPEMFVAALAGTVCLASLRLWRERAGGGAAPAAAVFGLGLALPVLAAFGLLALVLPAGAAGRGVLGAWPALLESGVAASPFYREGMGLDAPAQHGLQMLEWTAGLAAALLPVLLLAWAARRSRRCWPWAALAFGVEVVIVMAISARGLFSGFARPFPLFCLAVFLGALPRSRRGDENAGPATATAGFALFSLVLLGKMLLNGRLYQYGFVLAMPALALVTVMLLDRLPRWVASRGGAAGVVRAGGVPLLLVFALLHLSVTARFLQHKREWIGTGADAFRADGRARDLRAVVDWIAAHPVAGRRPTVLVVPEGVMINYLARSENPTPFVNFMPPEMLFFGETAMIAALDRRPPDVVVVTHKSTKEYGMPWFGRDYARGLAAWIGGRYHLVEIFGDPPLAPQSRFGAAVLVRNAERAAGR